MKYKSFIYNHLFITLLVLFSFFFIVGYFAYARYKPDFKISFGAEYSAIALNLLEGKGYSNPFYFDSGPTAWMPPTLVFILCFIFSIFGNGYLGFFILTGIKVICYVLSAYLALKFLQIEHNLKSLILFLSLVLLYLAFSAKENFRMITDLWLIVFIEMAFLYALMYYHRTHARRYVFCLLIILFFMPLISPAFTLASAIILIVYVIRNMWRNFRSISGQGSVSSYIHAMFIFRPHSWKLMPFILMGLIFVLSVFIWSYRNYRVFDKIIIAKSNLPFEFYLSNVKDYDGVLSNSTLILNHPGINPELVPEIKKMGEVRWIEKYQKMNRNYLKENKLDYVKKILNRFVNAFILITHDKDNIPLKSGDSILPEDYRRMDSLGLIHNGEWMCLTLKEREFANLMDQCSIKHPGEILNSFRNAKHSLYKKIYSPANIIRSLFMSLIPTLCLIFLFFRDPVKRSWKYWFVSLSYVLYLLVYIIASHQLRYQRPLFLLQILLIIMSVREISRIIWPTGNISLYRKQRVTA